MRLISPMGGCIATDKITIDGLKVDYMFLEEPNDTIDSGWRFFSCKEDQDYVDDPDNSMIYDVTAIATTVKPSFLISTYPMEQNWKEYKTQKSFK